MEPAGHERAGNSIKKRIDEEEEKRGQANSFFNEQGLFLPALFPGEVKNKKIRTCHTKRLDKVIINYYNSVH